MYGACAINSGSLFLAKFEKAWSTKAEATFSLSLQVKKKKR
jgi:hypothetical protein